MNIGNRNLGRRNQIVGPSHKFKQVFLKLGQLTRTTQTVGVHQIGHIAFLVTVFAGMNIQHKLDQGAM